MVVGQGLQKPFGIPHHCVRRVNFQIKPIAKENTPIVFNINGQGVKQF